MDEEKLFTIFRNIMWSIALLGALSFIAILIRLAILLWTAQACITTYP